MSFHRRICNGVGNDRRHELLALDPALSWRGSSEDGSLAYSMVRTVDGLHIERVRIRAGGGRSAQSALFADPGQLRAWCDCDDMRFEYVHLCTSVLGRGLELLDRQVSGGSLQTELRFG